MAIKLEEKVEEELEKLGAPKSELGRVKHYMGLIKNHDKGTYHHCLRVGLKFLEIASHCEMDSKLSLYTGLLHDVGKIKIKKSLLRKRKGFNGKDYKIMKTHPMQGYEILKEDFTFTALVILRHHYHQHNKYPSHPPMDHRMCNATQEKIREYSKILALADFYDAISRRKDDSFSVKPEIPGARKRKEEMLKAYPCKEEMIEELYKVGIFK